MSTPASNREPGRLDGDATAAGRSRNARGSARRPLVVGLSVLTLTLLGVAGWTGYEALRLQREANAAVHPLRALELSPRALAADRRLMRQAAGHADAARRAADSLPLRVASTLPFAGDDVRAARTLADALDTVVDRAGVPVTGLLDRVVSKPQSAPSGALLDTASLRQAGPTVTQAAAATRGAHARLAAIETESLSGPVRRPVEEATRRVGSTDSALTDVAAHLPALADLLGGRGRRQYLLVFQNLAEARPTGGIVGKWATVDVDRSALRMTGIGTNEDLSSLTLRGLPAMRPDFAAMYGSSLGPLANANLSPDFPSAARVIVSTWKQQGHRTPAGVISVDTRAVAGILALTGPVRVAGPHGPVTVSADNVVDVVQNRVYGWFAGQETRRQQFLSSLASTTFQRLGTTSRPAQELAATVQTLVQHHDVMAYAGDASQQRALEAIGVSGRLPAPTNATTRVHLTDNGGGKLDNYLAVATCTSATRLGLGLTNRLPSNYAAFVPTYALNQRTGSSRGTNLITAAFYVPAGRGVRRVSVDGHPAAVSTGSEKGWSVIRVPLAVPADATTKVVVELTGAGPIPDLTTQPLTRDAATDQGLCRQ